MMTDFTYKGVSARSMGVRIKSIKRPLLANIRQQYEDISGQHGSYSFGDGTLEDIIVEVECWIAANNRVDLRYKVRQVSAWLYSKERQRLTFSDETDVFYLARIANQIDPETLTRHDKFTLQFRCNPFSYTVQEQVDRQIISNSPHRFAIQTDGTAPTPPIISVKNIGSTVLNGFTLTIETEID